MTDAPVLRIRWVRPETDADIPMPAYMTEHAAGMDICAAVPQTQIIEPGALTMIPTGIAIALPPGFEAQIRPRSGLAAKHRVGMINSPGTIDPDYRGEIMVPLINLGKAPFAVNRGDRIAQMIIARYWQARVEVVNTLDETARGSGGFGHTGVS